MNESGVEYNYVRVIGKMSSFSIVSFNNYQQKREFKEWLRENGAWVKEERGLWFGDNVDKETREKERNKDTNRYLHGLKYGDEQLLADPTGCIGPSGLAEHLYWDDSLDCPDRKGPRCCGRRTGKAG